MVRHLFRRAGLAGTALALVAGATAASPAAADPPGAPGGRPFFQMPFACGLQMEVNPFGHRPALDMFRTPRSLTTGTPVLASADGVVVQSEFQDFGGNAVQIRHSGDWYTVAIHLQTRDVRVGQSVQRGQRIGTAGGTGTGANIPHVHYEQSHDDDHNGFVDWGKDHSERYPVEFNGVEVQPPPGESRWVTSANCVTPSSAGIGVFQPANHLWMAPGQVLRSNWGDPGDQPLVGDWNGDGEPGIAVFRPSTSTWYTPGHTWITNWGEPGDLAVGGDWNGDGTDEVAVFRPATSTWFARGRVLRSNWGEPGDLPVAGDFNNDGTDEIGVFRPSTGTWYTPGRTLRSNWGEPGDLPIVGDFDSNGTDEIGVFRPSTGTWITPGRVMRENWGSPGDLPIAGLNHS